MSLFLYTSYNNILYHTIIYSYNIPFITVHCSIGERSPRPLRSDLSYRGTTCCCKVEVSCKEEVPESISGAAVVGVVVVGVAVGVGVEMECKVCSSRGISCVPATHIESIIQMSYNQCRV